MQRPGAVAGARRPLRATPLALGAARPDLNFPHRARPPIEHSPHSPRQNTNPPQRQAHFNLRVIIPTFREAK